MSLALWIVTGLLAVVFLIAGAGMLFAAMEKMATKPTAGWVEDFHIQISQGRTQCQ